MEKKPIYAVIRYPKILQGMHEYDFNIYAMQTSNRAKIEEYYNSVRAKYPPVFCIAIVKRETAKQMHKIWCRYVRARPL